VLLYVHLSSHRLEADGQDAATSKFYQDGASTQAGGSAVAVPGEIKGLKALHDRYGSLPWKAVVEPSIALARDGFDLHRDMYEVSLTDLCLG
jgi:gamma-glutamyltranspeptidase